MVAKSDQQETGVVAIAPLPVSPVRSSSCMPPEIVDTKSGPGVVGPSPTIFHRDPSNEDPAMGQNTVPITPYDHAPSQTSDAKSGSTAFHQLLAPSNFFQQQTVPVEEEFQSVPIPQPYQQYTGSIPEDVYRGQAIPIPEPYPTSTHQQQVPTPEEYAQQAAPQYEEQPPPTPEAYPRNPSPSHPASSITTLSSPSFIEKPSFTFGDDLDEHGFTAQERREHQRSIQHLQALKYVLYSRWLIRIISVIVSLISFTLITITVVLFLRSSHSSSPQKVQDARGQVDNVDIRPSAAFASIGGIFTIISLAVNIGCCLSKKIRQITPLSNAIFATVAVVGISSWLSGCFYLHHNSAGRNLWYYVCAAAEQYHYQESHSDIFTSRMLFRRDSNNTDSKGLNFLTMCTYTQKSWDLGIAQACFEIVTLLNVIMAVVIVRWSWLRRMMTTTKR